MEKYGIQDSKDIQNDVVLKEVKISGNVCHEFAEFSISQVYVNKGKNDIDAVYTFPVPETAVITGFEAILGGRTIKAVVEDKKETIRIYEDAVERGISTLALEQFKDNVFQLAIGKILSNEKIKIKISYMDQLDYEDTAMKLVIPNVIGPRHLQEEAMDMEKEAFGKAEYKLTLNLLIESVSKMNFESPTHGISIEREDDTLSKITFKDKNAKLDKDFVLFLEEVEQCEASGMIYEYKEKNEEKSILYLRLIPELESEEEEEAKNYLFLVDISESMEGDKLIQAKNALHLCLRNLKKGDSFNIVAIESQLHYFSQVRRVDFNDETLKKASEWIDNLQAAYGADIFGALKYALSDHMNGQYSTIFLFTDDLVDDENPILDYVKENIKEHRIFTFGIDSSVNCYFINKLAEIGYGKSEFIYPNERIENEVLKQFKRISNPQVDILGIDWGKLNIEKTYPRTIDYLYDREPISIFAKAFGEIEGKITIRGKVGSKEYSKTIDLDNLDLEENANLIQKVWSRKRIEAIAEKLKGERGYVAESMKNKIIEISKESGIISHETSFVLLEEIEEPMLGVPLVHRIPLRISEETMKNIANAAFLESTSFSYTNYHEEESEAHVFGKESILYGSGYDRATILRILAKNQFAGGYFTDYNDISIKGKIETTALTISSFTLGKEDVSIYSNQINKALEFLLTALDSNKNVLDERIYSLSVIALKAALGKGILKGKQKDAVNEKLEQFKNIFAQCGYDKAIEILGREKSTLKGEISSIINIFADAKDIQEQIQSVEEKNCIVALAKLGIGKLL